jgi:hypothetical protein
MGPAVGGLRVSGTSRCSVNAALTLRAGWCVACRIGLQILVLYSGVLGAPIALRCQFTCRPTLTLSLTCTSAALPCRPPAPLCPAGGQ